VPCVQPHNEPVHPRNDPKITTGVDALRTLGMSDAEIAAFVSEAGLPSVHAAQVELRTYLRPVLSVKPHGEWPGVPWQFTLPLPLRGSPAFERAVDALPQAAAAGDRSWSGLETFDWDDEAHIWRMRYENTGAFHLDILELSVGGGALWFLGKFAGAYVSGIADRLAESTLEAAKRIRLRRSPATDCVTIKVPGNITTIVLPEPLTDEAREAFIDLDPAADEIRGKILYWEQDPLAWIAREQLPPDQQVIQPPQAYRPVLPDDNGHDEEL
jgi:hypothetical protein